jgi:hypothetical protein
MDQIMVRIYSHIDGVAWFALTDSQYASGKSISACTVLAMEAAVALQRMPYSPRDDIVSAAALDAVMQAGSSAYDSLMELIGGAGGPAHTSLDEVLVMPRYDSALRVVDHQQEFIRAGVFRELLDNACQHVPGDRWAAVITKFNVAVSVVYRGGDFLVFDSHGESHRQEAVLREEQRLAPASRGGRGGGQGRQWSRMC